MLPRRVVLPTRTSSSRPRSSLESPERARRHFGRVVTSKSRDQPASTASVRRRFFGTDGVRGIVGESLTADLVERLGRAATLWSGRGRVFIGRDTRGSGVELADAFARGVASAGGDAR